MPNIGSNNPLKGKDCLVSLQPAWLSGVSFWIFVCTVRVPSAPKKYGLVFRFRDSPMNQGQFKKWTLGYIGYCNLCSNDLPWKEQVATFLSSLFFCLGLRIPITGKFHPLHPGCQPQSHWDFHHMDNNGYKRDISNLNLNQKQFLLDGWQSQTYHTTSWIDRAINWPRQISRQQETTIRQEISCSFYHHLTAVFSDGLRSYNGTWNVETFPWVPHQDRFLQQHSTALVSAGGSAASKSAVGHGGRSTPSQRPTANYWHPHHSPRPKTTLNWTI